MSNYRAKAYNPVSRKIEMADYLDDYYGKHRYGVRFADGCVHEQLSCGLEAAADLIEQQAASLAAKDGAIRLLDERCAQYERRAEQAERALAEALSVVESLLLSLGNNNSDRVKAARRFMKEHTP